MRIQLDTNKKIIKIEENVLLSKLVETLSKLLPNGEWKKFTLEANTTISYWQSPIIIKEYPTIPTYPWYTQPYVYPSYICKTGATTALGSNSGSNVDSSLSSGIYNVQV